MTRYLQTLLLISGYLAIPAYSALLPDNAPDKSQPGQSGTNRCGTASSQNSMCQNAFLNSVDDFCLYAPPEPGPGSTIGNTERIEVAWCTKSNRGTRVIPAGAITGAHFIETPDFVQITGVGDFTKINIPKGDAGGELDPHGADGNGNPIGGLVFSSAFGNLQQIKEWTNFMSDSEFCFRACKPGPNAHRLCQHIYDVLGCMWNMPGRYDSGFTSCQADTGEPMGVYGTSTFFQGQPSTPAPHPAPSSSKCVSMNTIGGVALPTSTSSTTPTDSSCQVETSTPASTTSSSSTSSSNSVSVTSSSTESSPASTTFSPTSTSQQTSTSPPTSTSAATSTSASLSTLTLFASTAAAPAQTSDSSALGSFDGFDRLVITFGVCLALGVTLLL